nr:cytochrome P450 monooxygenase 3 [Garcinia xanthochymus]
MADLYFYLGLFLSLFVLSKLFFGKKHNYPPGPPALPVVGHLHLLKPPLYFYFEKVAKRFGPIVLLWMGKVPVLVVTSPAAFEECFTKNDVIFADRPKSVSGGYLTFNYTLLVWAPHGPVWRALRRLTFSEIFSPKALQKSSSVREDEVRHLVKRFFRYSADGNRPKIDMKYMFTLLTTNVIMRLAAGKRHVPFKDEETKEEKALYQLFKDLFFPIVSMTICDFIPVFRWIGYKGLEKSYIGLAERREVLLGKLVRELKERRIAAKKGVRVENDGEENGCVGDTIMVLQETDPDFYTDDIVKGVLMMMFIAGTETSTATLEWALTLLLQHPDKMEKLKAEIDNVVGHERFLTEADFPKLPYLRNVVKEALRLYPPVPLSLPHFSTEATTVGGYEIPKGTMVFANVWAMHRDPKTWENPEAFEPERFEVEREGYVHNPFGAGRRICPGGPMGTHIVSLGLGMLMQCFDWDQIGMDEDMSHSKGTASLTKAKALMASFVPCPHMVKLLSQLVSMDYKDDDDKI